jgi:predicted DNA-binding transcriptional regulator AlpA
MDERLWTARELASYLGYSESTITRMVSQSPDKLPPRVAGLERPRWVPAIAQSWVREQSAPRSRLGRPRRV